MFRRLCVVVFVSGLFTVSGVLAARADAYEDHLEPVASIYNGMFGFDYQVMVARYFEQGPGGKDQDHDLLASAIVLPAFTREYSISIKKTDGKYSIATIAPEVMLFKFFTMQLRKAEREAGPPDAAKKADDELEWIKYFRDQGREPPERPEDIKAERCVRDIHKALAKKILLVWYGMLRGTRYPDDPLAGKGFDGIRYYFTMKWAGFDMAGKVWSPPKDLKTGRLAALAKTMRRYCREGGAGVKKQLTQQADDLLKRLGG